MADLDEARKKAQAICEATRAMKPMYGSKSLGSITVSIGVSSYPSHGMSPAHLIKAADDALYAAKNKGRDQVVVAN
jgi:diguanylate cyclase (GGDEF)-like protein